MRAQLAAFLLASPLLAASTWGALLLCSCAGEEVNLGNRPPSEDRSPSASEDGDSTEGSSTEGGAPGVGSSLPSLFVTGVAPVGELNTSNKEDNVTLTADELELCFTSERPGGTGDVDVYCATRSSPSEAFGAAAEAQPVNAAGFETSAALDLEGLSLWVGSDRPGGKGGLDIWRSDRVDRDSPWQAPVLEESLNTPRDDIPRPPNASHRIMPLASRSSDGTYWSYEAQQESGGGFSTPRLIEELAQEGRSVVDGFLSRDGRLLLYVLDTEADGSDIFYSVRARTGDPFGAPIRVAGLNGSADDRDPWLSLDGSSLYFVSDRDGDFDIYRAESVLLEE